MAELVKDKRDDYRKAFMFGILALFLISFAAMGSYFSYDEIGALFPRLKSELGFSSTHNLAFYAAYSISAILLVVLGGILADKLGVKKAALLFATLIAVGTMMVSFPSFKIMLIGRLIFGIGCEAYYVVMNKIIAKWFRKKLLAFAFGVNLFLVRAGTYASFFLLPWIANRTTMRTTLLIVTGITFLGIVTTILYWLLDNHGEKKGYVDISEEGIEDDEKFVVKDVFKLPSTFWVISVLCALYYSAIFPFTAFATDFFVERYEMTHQSASRLTGIIILISMLSTWFFGLVIDKIGKRATLMIIGSILMVPCHFLMGYSSINPVIPMVVLGLSFSLVPAALWPAIPLMVKEKQLGTAFGVIAMIQNIGLFAFPLIAGYIRDHTGSYNLAMLMFSSLGVIAVFFAFWLRVLEGKKGGYLEKA